ncbi:MAG: hypothetical protein AABZ64_04850, partial [Nitrospinota bacterium]
MSWLTAHGAPLLDAGRVDEIVDAGSPPFHLLYQAPTAGDELDRLLRGLDASVFFTRDLEGGAARRLAGLRGTHFAAPPFPPEEEEIHTAEWMVRALAPLGIEEEPVQPLSPSGKSREKARALMAALGLEVGPEGPRLAIHPGSGSRGKWAPSQALAGIARDFRREEGARLFLIQGPA